MITQVFDVARFPPWIHCVDIDVGERFFQRMKRMFCVKLRAKQSGFFSSGSHKQQRAAWRRIQVCEGARELDKRCNAGRIIDRAVKNLVALQLWMTSEMVPVRSINDV